MSVLRIERVYTKECAGDPYKGIQFVERSVEIVSGNGTVIFQQDRVIVPDFWSMNAVTILAKNYFRQTVNQGKGESDLRDVIDRLTRAWTSVEYTHLLLTDEERAILKDEYSYMLAHQIMAPNSPQWFNTGLYEMYNMPPKANGEMRYFVDDRTKQIVATEDDTRRAQAHACFIVGLEDNLVGESGIYEAITTNAKLFKLGSGSGLSMTKLRAKNDSLSGGGNSSGPLSFAKVVDASAASIKSGGTTRRAAQMITIDVEHDDVLDFVNWKGEEESKLATLVHGSKLLREFWFALTGWIRYFVKEDLATFDDWSNEQITARVRFHVQELYAYLIEHRELEPKAEILDVLALYLHRGVDEKNILRSVRTLHEMTIDTFFSSLAEIQQVFQNQCPYPLYNYDFNGAGVQSLTGQSVNISIRAGDQFFDEALEDSTSKSARILRQIALRAWESADPALQYRDAINNWHTCPNSGSINSSNPCSEFMFLDNTACNLASINLAKFVDQQRKFDYITFSKVVSMLTIMLETSITMAHFPTKEIAWNSYRYRPLGLGYCNIGYMLALMNLPYGNDRRTFHITRAITGVMQASAYQTSARMAHLVGAFDGYQENEKAMIAVLEKHATWAKTLQPSSLSPDDFSVLGSAYHHQEKILKGEDDDSYADFYAFTQTLWQSTLLEARQYGVRNAQATVIAPTGTIGFVMDAATTGIEPEFSYKTMKKVMDGSWMELSSATFEAYLRANVSEADEQKILQTMQANGNDFVDALSGFPCDIQERLLHLVKVANSINPSQNLTAEDHLLMMSAAQPMLSGAISKTINLHHGASIREIESIFVEAWRLGLKGVTVYRDGCKGSQPLNIQSKNGTSPLEELKNRMIELNREQYENHHDGDTAIVCATCGSKGLRNNGTCYICAVCGATTGCS
ncbi:adenosylcobalamin-dependent ribonucleoside-diphosphate reductase [Entomospira entomophila]|uniref:Vitamin B12-dependent ribonucleotide reductase n=1 Tax=Entomospira entomophila TaxID=2719988 RepID=A0A968GCL7_9SPIO|nr:adenosylcobalamin-dependent ribonucleoside-diphosphate reductase [Entomospira entomophilus]NIZ39994.1 adenosylcobalamin-dependent ribonucleoside-diphosphate reductase [Entomospira entomophilus]WDI35554.1 adenosylcobalamin-dependent ribonucleoside-diphosphate reductase [Entomospira entomophilus]